MAVIQVTNTYSGQVLAVLDRFRPDGFTLRTIPENSEDALLAVASDADYILASGRVKITAEILHSAKRLKMIQRTGVGLDSIDLEALKRVDIPLYVNRGINAQSVAEHTVLLILASLRRLCTINENTKQGIWNKQDQGITTYELQGKTVGFVGMGSIGKITAKLLYAFGAELLYYDQYRCSSEIEEMYHLHYVSFEELTAKAQIITLHCPLTDNTRGMISAKTIAGMRDHVIIVNTARGSLIDEQALYSALISGKVGAAALDVHCKEPITDTSGLISLPNVIATPHIGGVTYDAFSQMMQAAMHNIALFHQGRQDEIAQFRYI